MQPQQMSYGGRAGYADGGLGSLMQAPQGMQQAAGGQMDPQQALQTIIQLLIDNGVPLKMAKKLALQMLHIFMQGGEPALESFANDLEQQEAMAHGGIAGYAHRQHYLFGGIGRAIGNVVGGIGKAVSGVVKGIANAVKSVVKSPIGKMALLAGGAYLMMNPAALSGLFGGAAAAEGAATTAGALTAGEAGTLASTVTPSAASAAALTDYAPIAMTPSQVAATNAFNAGIPGAAGSTIASQGITAANVNPALYSPEVGTTFAGPNATIGNQLASYGSQAWDYAKQLPGKALQYAKDNPISTALTVTNLLSLGANLGIPRKENESDDAYAKRVAQTQGYITQYGANLKYNKPDFYAREGATNPFPKLAANGGIMGYAMGGRIGYEDAGPVQMASEPSGMDELDSVSKEIFGKGFDQLDEKQQEQLQDWIKSRKPSAEQQPIFNQMASPDAYVKLVEHYMSLGYNYEQASKMAYEHFKTGEDQSPSTPGDFRNYKKVAMGGMIPPARKAGGIMELDARDTGGFIPYGKKERHDDVPAVLAKNEFVFTSKAVRNAGGGDIKKGAKKMYALMRQLEGARA
jgi:hypothetical protein